MDNELHFKQFDLFLEEQSFTHRRNKDIKDVERSSCGILSMQGLHCTYILCYIHNLMQLQFTRKNSRKQNSRHIIATQFSRVHFLSKQTYKSE